MDSGYRHHKEESLGRVAHEFLRSRADHVFGYLDGEGIDTAKRNHSEGWHTSSCVAGQTMCLATWMMKV